MLNLAHIMFSDSLPHQHNAILIPAQLHALTHNDYLLKRVLNLYQREFFTLLRMSTRFCLEGTLTSLSQSAAIFFMSAASGLNGTMVRALPVFGLPGQMSAQFLF